MSASVLLTVLGATIPRLPATQYTWCGHTCSYVTAGPEASERPPIVLIHGFAGSAYNAWRATIPALARTHRVYALDLLGLGASAKPTDVRYSIELWRDQCADFVRERCETPPVVIGHSFGSLIALELARMSECRAIAMMNCAIGMNNKNALALDAWRREQPASVTADLSPLPVAAWQLAAFGAVLSAVDALFSQRWLLSALLERFATAPTVRNTLISAVYKDASRVDAPLVDDYVSLAADRRAACEVLRQIYTNEAGPLPFEALGVLDEDTPLLAVWGDDDRIAPADGPVGRCLAARARRLDATQFERLPAGHVPQDDCPEETNTLLLQWLEQL